MEIKHYDFPGRTLGIYRRMSDPAKATIWFCVCNILQKGIALLSTPVFTRIMTTGQYGTYTLYQSWISLISIFATLNLQSGVLNNGLTHHSDEKNELVVSFQSLSSTVTLLLFVVYLSALPFFSSLMQLPAPLIFVMFIQMFFEPAFLYWSVEQRYDYKYRKLVAVTLLMSFASVIIGIVSVLLAGQKDYARVISYAAVTAAVGFLFYIRNCIRSGMVVSVKYWKFALNFSIPLIPHFLASTILNQADRIMIGRMAGKEQAAVYGIAYTLSMMMMIVVNAVGNTYVPYMYKSMKNKEYDKLPKITDILVFMVAGLVLCSVLFGPELLALFASGEYYEARWIIPPVALSVYFSFVYTIYGNIEFYFQKTFFIMAASIMAALVNIALNYVFIGIFGYLAAGYTTLASYILFAFCHYIFSNRIMRENGIRRLFHDRLVLALSVFMVAVMLAFTMLYPFPIIRYAILASVLAGGFVGRKKIIQAYRMLKG